VIDSQPRKREISLTGMVDVGSLEMVEKEREQEVIETSTVLLARTRLPLLPLLLHHPNETSRRS